MADKSRIEWCDATLNPAGGCSPVSPACDNCYAARLTHRLAANIKIPPYFVGLTDESGGWNGKINLHPQLMKQAFRWQKPRRILVGSMTDMFHESIPDDFLDHIFAVMALIPRHTFILLTKRPERLREYVCSRIGDGRTAICRQIEAMPHTLGNRQGALEMPLPNVWIGVTVEHPDLLWRIPLLLDTPAVKRFVSIEPMLGPMNLHPCLQRVIHQDEIGLAGREGPLITANGITDHDPWLEGLSWVIAGGESGPGARPMHPDWIRSLRDQCAEAGVPFFFKGWGEWGTARIDLRDGLPAWDVFHSFEHYCNKAPTRMCKGDKLICPDGHVPTNGGKVGKTYPMAIITRVGKRKAGRLLDGREHNDFPESM